MWPAHSNPHANTNIQAAVRKDNGKKKDNPLTKEKKMWEESYGDSKSFR
jgi:hypothetical protein